MEIPGIDTEHGLTGLLISIIVLLGTGLLTLALKIWSRFNGDLKAAKAVADSAVAAAAVAKATADELGKNSVSRAEFLQYMRETTESRVKFGEYLGKVFDEIKAHSKQDNETFQKIGDTLARLDERSKQGRHTDSG